jgi:hypothetical protein
MAATGQLAAFQDSWLDYLKNKVDPQTFAQIKRAFEPPEPDLFQPDSRPPLPPMAGDPAKQLGYDPARLPEYGSPQARAQVAAERRYRGPADFPSNNGVRVSGR